MDAMYMSYKCGVMKPDERLFRHVLETENIIPEETLFVDDGPRNIEAAARLGVKTFCPKNGADWTSEIYKYLSE
jgi:putative hydrolase of the HAD superfamily